MSLTNPSLKSDMEKVIDIVIKKKRTRHITESILVVTDSQLSDKEKDTLTEISVENSQHHFSRRAAGSASSSRSPPGTASESFASSSAS